MKVSIPCFLLCWQAVHSNLMTNDRAVNRSAMVESLKSMPSENNRQTKKNALFSQQFRSRFPYSQPDYVYRAPRREYRLEDFLWAGSGEGPTSEDLHDGMAWEDGIQSLGTTAIKVTKTMVLYKTVLSTIYPIEMTPTVIGMGTPKISSSPVVSEGLQGSPEFGPTSQGFNIQFTPSLSLSTVKPTVTLPSTPVPQTKVDIGESDNSSGGLHDKLSSGSADLQYRVQTTIKSKRDAMEYPHDIRFQEDMQRKLAQVYAKAFKRQFLRSLVGGGSNQHNKTINSTSISLRNTNRKRRWSPNDQFEIDAVDLAQPIYYSEMNQIAKAAMNVTVSILSITWSKPVNLIHIIYVVYAEGTPIPGFISAKELNTVTKEEMEKKIGYEIHGRKAEALIQPLEAYATVGVSPTPWIVVLVVMVCIMFVILVLTLFMAWKWKNNRPRGDRERISHAEVGEASPEQRFPRDRSSPRSQQVYSREGSFIRERRVSPVIPRNPPNFHFDKNLENDSVVRNVEDESSQSMTELSDQQLIMSEGKSSSSNLIGATGSRTTPQRYKSKSFGVSKKINKRKKRRRKSDGIPSVDDKSSYKSQKKEPTSELPDQKIEEQKEFSLATDICRNMDKISFGNLDIYTDSLARTPSAHAKKVIESRPSSHEHKQRKHNEERQRKDLVALEALNDFKFENNFPEQDRDMSEKSFEITDSASVEVGSTRDAEAQTPTRLIKRSPRVRTSPKHRKYGKMPKMSLLSTKAEEKVVFHDYNSSSDDLNPLGRMRKRFHEFLDDAFSVMASGGKRENSREKAPQSAKVTVSHEVKSKSPGRPWTSHIIREESVRKVRPKSSVVLGIPKSAWTAGSERRCQSAKSKSSEIIEESPQNNIVQECGKSYQRNDNPSSVRSTSTTHTEVTQSSPTSKSKTFIFPKYPTYPEMEICLENDPSRTAVSQSSHYTRSRLHPTDPAVPLIEAIKDEMKRFERVKISNSKADDNQKC